MVTAQQNHATVYQLECLTQNKGKRVASTKRRIRWRFGFADMNAIQAGKVGKECRGAEHEVVLVWSWTSGKQLILADGHEVHWAKSKKEKMEVTWDMVNGNHKLQVVSQKVKSKNSSEAHPFDLLIDGRSFYDMPSVFELGSHAMEHSKSATFAVEQPLRRPRASRSSSMPDLLDVPGPAKPVVSITTQRSPTSSMDLTAFVGSSNSCNAPPTMPSPTANQRQHTWHPQTSPATVYSFSCNESLPPKNSLSNRQKRESFSSINESSFCDTDSQLSAALNALGVDLGASSLHGKDSFQSSSYFSHSMQHHQHGSFASMTQLCTN
eukprot:scaffold5901_cov116-Cylindrotheca_fusiformis.AAC.2